MISSDVVSNIFENFDLESYFTDTSDKSSQKEVVSKIFVDKRVKPGRVFSASKVLNSDLSLMMRGEELLENVRCNKAAYQQMIDQIYELYSSFTEKTDYNSFKEVLLHYKKNHLDYSIKWGIFEGKNCDLKKEVDFRLEKDKTPNYRSPALLNDFAECNESTYKKVCRVLDTFSSNTSKIRTIPNDFATAMLDAQSIVPDFCYEFCYLCYLISKKTIDSLTAKGDFASGYPDQYNFIDNQLQQQ